MTKRTISDVLTVAQTAVAAFAVWTLSAVLFGISTTGDAMLFSVHGAAVFGVIFFALEGVTVSILAAIWLVVGGIKWGDDA